MSNLTQELIETNFAGRVQAYAKLEPTPDPYTLSAARALALSRGWTDPLPEGAPLHPASFALDWLDNYPPAWPWLVEKHGDDTPRHEDLIAAMYWLRVEGQLTPHAARAQHATRPAADERDAQDTSTTA